MVGANDLGATHADLMARIDAARRRLVEENRMEWAEIGHILESMSRELEELSDDHHQRAKTYARLDGELSAIHDQLDSAGR